MIAPSLSRPVAIKVLKDDLAAVVRLLPGRLAEDASALYARNVLNLLQLVIDKETKALKIDWEDEIIKGLCVTRDGAIVHPALQPKPDKPNKRDSGAGDGAKPAADGDGEANANKEAAGNG